MPCQLIFAIRAGQRAASLVVDDASAPQVTGDGKTVVFQRAGDKPGLYRVNIDGSGLALLMESTGVAPDTLILPDDQTVLFLSNRSGIYSLWSVSLAGGARSCRTARIHVSLPGGWAGGHRMADGKRLAITRGTSLADIVLIKGIR